MSHPTAVPAGTATPIGGDGHEPDFGPSARRAPHPRNWIVPVLAVVLAACVFHLIALSGDHSWYDDWAQYVGHARNIVEGRTYADTGYIYNPQRAIEAPASYPPGFPLVLAPIYAVFGADLVAMKVEQVGLLALALVLVGALLAPRLRTRWIVAIVALMALSPIVQAQTNAVLSDLLFLALTMLALLLIDRRPAGGTRLDRSALGGAPVGLVIFLATATRTIGIALAVTLVALDLLASRRLAGSTVVAVVTFGALVALQTIVVGAGGGYLDTPPTPAALASNALGYPADLDAMWGTAPIAALVGALGVFGYVVQLRRLRRAGRAPTVLEIFPVPYLLLVLAYPAFQGSRYLLPIVPLLLWFTLIGVATAARRLRAPPALAGATLVVLVAVSCGVRYAQAGFEWPASIRSRASSELLRFVSERTPSSSVIVSDRPRAIALLTGRPGSVYAAPSGTDELVAYMGEIGARYIVVAPAEERFDEDPGYLPRFVAEQSGRLRRVFRNAEYSVYVIRPAPGAHAPADTASS